VVFVSDSNPIQYINVLESHFFVMVAVRPKEQTEPKWKRTVTHVYLCPFMVIPISPPLPQGRTQRELQAERVGRFKR